MVPYLIYYGLILSAVSVIRITCSLIWTKTTYLIGEIGSTLFWRLKEHQRRCILCYCYFLGLVGWNLLWAIDYPSSSHQINHITSFDTKPSHHKPKSNSLIAFRPITRTWLEVVAAGEKRLVGPTGKTKTEGYEDSMWNDDHPNAVRPWFGTDTSWHELVPLFMYQNLEFFNFQWLQRGNFR